jgi:tyrosyl-tRNA synthetase
MAQTKQIPQYDPQGPITEFQKKRIMANCKYQVDTKNEYVQWVTEDVNRTSLRSITQEQAVKIIRAQEGSEALNPTQENWGKFDYKKSSHKVILSLMHQAGWTINHPDKGEIADLNALDGFLKSDKSPVKKALLKMEDSEVQKVIKALKQIIKSKYK